MTQNEADAIRTQFDSIGEKIDRLTAIVGSQATAIAGLDATLSSMKEVQTKQIDVLFGQAAESTRRISEIERDYTPRKSHEFLRLKVESLVSQDEHDELEDIVSDLSGKMWFYMGAACVVGVILGVVVSVVVPKVIG